MRAAILYVTGACNLRCKHCGVGADQLKPRPQLTTEEIHAVLSNLARIGTKYVTILGGEATVYRNDLADILDQAQSLGIQVSINTNLLLYEPVESLLTKPSLKGLIVSLDGASPETHDMMRGRGTFQKTVSNIKLVSSSPRALSGDLTIEISYVISKLNIRDAGRMIPLTESLGASRLNVTNVKLTGRAEHFAESLSMDHSDLLDAYCSIIITWLFHRRIQLDVYIPPAFALYLNERFGFDFPVDAHPACGGISEYGYVDLLGNLLPCPAMSYEEDQIAGVKTRDRELNLLKADSLNILTSSLFTAFERSRTAHSHSQQLFPCKYCSFRDSCFPCTSDIVRGKKHSEVEICSAIYKLADETLPGFTQRIFSSSYLQEGIQAQDNGVLPHDASTAVNRRRNDAPAFDKD